MLTINGEQINELRKQGLTWKEIASEANASYDTVRNRARRAKNYEPEQPPAEQFKRKENRDGSITSTLRSKRIEKILLDDEDILIAHRFDPKFWKIRQVLSNEWESNSKDGIDAFYQSKVVIIPNNGGELNRKELLTEFKKDIKPVTIKGSGLGETNLVIQVADPHFGITNFEMTKQKLSELVARIEFGYKTIVIEQLGDLFHSSQLQSSQTLKGTPLDHVDMPQAIEDAKLFFDVIIRNSLKNAKQVIIEHAAGNHSGNLEYMFLIYLEAKYPQVKVNYHNEPRTVYKLDNVGIMLSHGDSVPLNKLPALFANEYKLLWAECETLEVHTGHKHNQYIKQEKDGVILRQAPTFKPNDNFEIVKGWTTNRKIIMAIEYNEDVEVASYPI